LDATELEASRSLKLICVAATGANNIDLNAAKRANIAVCNARGYATASVVQHVFAMILCMITRLTKYQRDVHAGKWQKSSQFCLLDHPISELSGKTMGIVGFGELGNAVAKLAEAFSMHVLVSARAGAVVTEGRVPLNSLLPRVDILSLHCPLVPETTGLIGATELALMKPGAILVNTARGGIVDESALAKALNKGQLGGACVDVLSNEPPTSGNPLLDYKIPNLILTPHIAWASKESRQRLVEDIRKNIIAFLKGDTRNRLA